MSELTDLPLIDVRPAVVADIDGLKAVIETTGLFPADMLDDMIGPHLAGRAPDQIWLTAIGQERPLGVAFAAPEQMTDRAWNLYLIAVDRAVQARGIGKRLVAALETALVARSGRLLLVETSGLPDFEPTWLFYERCGFRREAIVRDFYRDGEDKLVFRKLMP